jgi:hypothetical protein
MSPKKRKRRRIPQETIDRLMAADENYQRLLGHLERLRIELSTGKRPPPTPQP